MSFCINRPYRFSLLAVFYFFAVEYVLFGSVGSVEENLARTVKDNSSVIHLVKREINNRAPFDNSLLKAKECEGLRQICPQLQVPSSDNLDVLLCVNKDQMNNAETLNGDCQHSLWTYTTTLLKNIELRRAVTEYCESDWDLLPCKPTVSDQAAGNLLKCLFDNVKIAKEKLCINFIERLKLLAFLDSEAMSLLLEDCTRDIQSFKCGRIDGLREKSNVPHGTLSCLQDHVDKLTEVKCRDKVLYLSELQAEDINFDRDLFVHCTPERLSLCREVPLAAGQMYKCLMEHKLEINSPKCNEDLLRHEHLIVQDYQVSRGLVRVCKEDIRTHHCRKSVSDDREIRLAQILLCLENATKNGTRVNKECSMEMLTHRKILMEDYRLSPELVARCSEDIDRFCKGLEVGGKTIHCLMEHARLRKKKDRISMPCQREVETLVKETDAGEDWRVDPVLRLACQHTVQIACKDARGGNSRVMSCLMERLGTEMMTEECETALLQIQYFVARDYKLDTLLYRGCREDAGRLCHAKRSWADGPGSTDPERGALVLPCLYRYTLPSNNAKLKLKPSCLKEVSRVMRERALSVQLEPEVETVCLDSLASLCNEKTNPGEEMLCLQDNIQQLDSKCKAAVSNFTELQSAHIELNPIILQNCHKVMDSLCQNEMNTGDGEDIMDCLIEHKNDPFMRLSGKCRAAVEHHQIISLKTFHFTFRFKEACRSYVSRYCPNAQTKSQVVSCLSEVVRNDTLDDQRPHIPKDCRHQLRLQLLQQRESVDLDVELKKSCSLDITKFCANVAHGNARVLDCLESKKKELSMDCYKRIFNIERQEMSDSSTDYTLINTCRTMILKYCRTVDTHDALECLKKFKYDVDFDRNCRLVVLRRMMEQNSDIRLNPTLQRECKPDISKFCLEAVYGTKDDSQVEIKVIRCLKNKFRERKLTLHCEQQLSTVLKEAALNYQLNPLLTTLCSSEIKQLCEEDKWMDNEGEGRVEECLKKALLKGQITNRACRIEVVELIKEGKADIHTDPLLYRACAIDIQNQCNDISKGDSRQLECMLNVLRNEDRVNTLQPDCRSMLEQRIEMYKIEPAKQVDNFHDLYYQVSRSPVRRYFVVVAMTFIGMIFITGLFCGRVMRRSVLIKNK